MLIWLSLLLAIGHAGPRPTCEGALAVQKAFLYRLSDGRRDSYLLGSRHFGVGLDRMPLIVRQLVATAGTVVFETRGSGARIPPPTNRLSVSLSLDAWTELTERLGEKGLPPAVVDDLTPAVAYFLLTTEPNEVTSERLDHEILNEARAHGARIKALERVADLERVIEDIVDARELERVLIGPPRDHRIDMSYYVRGDEAAGERTLADLRARHPRLFEKLVVERNVAWVPKILGAHRRPGLTLNVVGALHLGGEYGLLNLLRARGLTVERVE